MPHIRNFYEKVDKFTRLDRPTIAFGLLEVDHEILKSLKRGARYAQIKLVGPRAIKSVKGFDVLVDEQPEKRLATMLARGEVDGIIRGTVADTPTREAYKKLTGEWYSSNPALCEVREGTERKEFFWR